MAEEITNQNPKPIPIGILGEFGEDALLDTSKVNTENIEIPPVAPTEGGQAQPEPQQGQAAPQTSPVEEPPTPATDPADWFDLTRLNERFGTEFKSEDDIKALISSLTDNQELISKRDYYKELEETLQAVVDQASQMYGSKEGFAARYKIEHLSQGKDAGVVSRIVTSDIDKLSELEALALRLQYLSPSLADKPDKVVKGLLKEYGVDIDDPDFNPDNIEISDPQQLVRLAQHGADAKSYLKNLVDGVQVPEIKDFKSEVQAKVAEKQKALAEQEAARQKLADQWTGKVKDITDQLKTIEFKRKDKDGNETVKFTYDVPQDFVKSLIPYLSKYAVDNGYDLTQENVAKVQSELVQFVKEEHIDELMDAYASHVSSKIKDEVDNKVHNNKPINQTEAPADHVKSYEDQVNEQFLRQLGMK